MSIRINLLAEAKIAEDLRRRDPVKRAIFFGSLMVVFALVWSSSLQVGVMMSKNDLTHVQASIMNRTNEYQSVLASKSKVAAIEQKLTALQQLNQARFQHGNYLNSLQQATMDGVELVRIRVNQTYAITPATPNETVDGHVVFGHPGTILEKTVLTLDAKDFSPNPGDEVDKFKENIANQSYFKTMLSPTNGVKLTSLSSPQAGPDGRLFVLFNLECNYPQKIR